MLKIHHLMIVLSAFFLLVTAAQAEGQSQGEVEVLLQQFKVVKRADTEVLESAERVIPGEVVEYQVTYRNTSKRPVRQLQATLPIPPESEYVAGSARPAAVQASLDGITFAAVPLRHQVKLTDGKVEVRDVPIAQYRSLRWSVGELAAGQKAVVSARVRVESSGTASPDGTVR